jgi:hypothetical protein
MFVIKAVLNEHLIGIMILWSCFFTFIPAFYCMKFERKGNLDLYLENPEIHSNYSYLEYANHIGLIFLNIGGSTSKISETNSDISRVIQLISGIAGILLIAAMIMQF